MEMEEAGAFEVVKKLLYAWFDSFVKPGCLLVCSFGAKYAFICPLWFLLDTNSGERRNLF